MYVVTVDFLLQPERTEDFMQSMLANARQSREHEPGCRRFDVCRNMADPARVFLYEVYTDRAAFDAHLASAHYQNFDSRVAGMVISKDVRTYDEVIA